MPDGWLVDVPRTIPDNEATQPDDWEVEADGEWEVPQIDNPDCVDHKCGEWVPEMISNPDFKGPWYPPRIDNPDYKGPWSPKQMTNADYYLCEHPHHLAPISAVGFDLWTMNKKISFDNIAIGHDWAAFERLFKETWELRNEIEKSRSDSKKSDKSNEVDTPASLLNEVLSTPVGMAVVGGAVLLFLLLSYKVLCRRRAPVEEKEPEEKEEEKEKEKDTKKSTKKDEKEKEKDTAQENRQDGGRKRATAGDS
eukprot:Trichotokara_eunicae@DN2848_c0_g1_i2.p1